MNAAGEIAESRAAFFGARQQERAAQRRAEKRKPGHVLPSRYLETIFLARLNKRSLAYLGRQQAKLKRLLSNRDRFIAEHGGPDSMAARAVKEDGRKWERQLALVQGLIVKRTMTPAKRDARPLKKQKVKA